MALTNVLLLSLLIILANCQFAQTENTTTELPISEIEDMVPVSSTVIPVVRLFGNSKPEATGTGEVSSFFPAFTYIRRSRFYEKSTKPIAPVRLITKNKPHVDEKD